MMKKLAILALFVAGVLSAADYSGTWNGKGMLQDTKYGGIPNTVQLTLIQSGSSIQGTVKLNNGKPIAIDSGSVSGTQVSLALHSESTQVTAQLADNGSGQLTGQMTTSTGQVYAVTFTKQ